MFNIISHICERGLEVNEDASYASDTLMIVVDGATPLCKNNLTNDLSDAKWFAATIISSLVDILRNSEIQLKDALSLTADATRKKLDSLGYFPKNYPSASIAIARINGKYLECCTLGDAPIILQTKADTIHTLYDESVAVRDAGVIKTMVENAQKQRCSIKEAKESVADILLKNRLEMNTDGAYYIFDPSGKGVQHARIEQVPLADIVGIALMSDGFYSAYSCYKIVDTLESLVKMLFEDKASLIMSQIREISNKDAQFNNYPRFKKMDDSTVVVASLK